MRTFQKILYRLIVALLFTSWTSCSANPSVSVVSTKAVATPTMLFPTLTALPANPPTRAAEPTSIPVLTRQRSSDGMMMSYIPGGKFTIGSNNGEADEAPTHEVSLDSYWMDGTEITNRMYGMCVDAGICKPPYQIGSYTRSHYFDAELYADYPVIYVDWDMANTYCQWAGARLPTEAEWEMAASGGDGRIFPWGNEWDVAKFKRLNFADRRNSEMAFDMTVDDGYRDTSPVRSFPLGVSPYGIYDLDGNVWEWVADWYDPFYYNYSPLDNPQGPESPTGEVPLRSMRGGGWVAANDFVFHTYNRHGVEPYNFSSSIGFRCAES